MDIGWKQESFDAMIGGELVECGICGFTTRKIYCRKEYEIEWVCPDCQDKSCRPGTENKEV